MSIYGIEKREKFFLPANAILYERLSDFYVWMNQAVIDHEKLRYTLETAKTERYVELELACVAYSADSNNNNSFTHSFLIYKAQNGRYIFFDSNVGATGFCCDKGTADFTLEEVCEAIELSATFYVHNVCISEKFPNIFNSCKILVLFRDATLVLEKIEEFYSTTKNPNSEIMEISVDQETNKLVFKSVNTVKVYNCSKT